MPYIASTPTRTRSIVTTGLVILCGIAFVLVIVMVAIYGMNGTMDLMHKTMAELGM